MVEFRGKHAKLELKNGAIFTGYVHSLDNLTSKLTLQKVVTGDGKRLPGLKNFFYNELEDVAILEDAIRPTENDKLIQDEYEKGKRLQNSKQVPAHLRRMKDYHENEYLLSHISNCTGEDKDRETKSANKSSDYDSGSDKEPGDTDDAPYILIDKIDQYFHEAIACIKNTSIVGFAMEGVCIGRGGTLCWLQFSTGSEVFIFDALMMEGRCFDEGIKDILEDPDILKVMHDCRLPSDLLHHQYQVSLINVFDTQVADVFVYRLHHGNDWPRYVQGLPACLFDHMDLSFEQVHCFKVREKLKEKDQEEWARRPAHRNILLAAMKNVMYLKKLRVVLMEKMMAEYVTGVNVYLSYVKDASKHDAKKFEPSRLPLVFQELPSMMSRRHTYAVPQRSNNETTDEKGFRDNCSGIKGNNIIYSHDSLWHIENGKNVKSQNIEAASKSNSSITKGKSSISNDDVELIQSKLSQANNLSAVTSDVSEMKNYCPSTHHITSKQDRTISDIMDTSGDRSTELPTGNSSGNIPSSNTSPSRNTPSRNASVSGNMQSTNTSPSGNIPSANTYSSDSDNSLNVGQMIRSVLRQNKNVLDSTDNINLTPAGLDTTREGVNSKTTRKRIREVEATEIDMFMSGAVTDINLESALENSQSASNYDDWDIPQTKSYLTPNHHNSEVADSKDWCKRGPVSPSALSSSSSCTIQNCEETIYSSKRMDLPSYSPLHATEYQPTIINEGVQRQNDIMIPDSDFCGQRSRYRNDSKVKRNLDGNIHQKCNDVMVDETVNPRLQHLIKSQRQHTYLSNVSQHPTQCHPSSPVSPYPTQCHPSSLVSPSTKVSDSEQQYLSHFPSSPSTSSPQSSQSHLKSPVPSVAKGSSPISETPSTIREFNSAMASTTSRFQQLKLMVQAMSQSK